MEDIRYGHYNELVEIGLAYLDGKISRGLFEEAVNRILVFIHDGIKQFQAIQFPPTVKLSVKEDIEKAKKGFLLFEEGVEKMRKVVDQEEKNQETFWQGVGLAKFGCDLLNEVMLDQKQSPEDKEP